jgi:hypothetical protein
MIHCHLPRFNVGRLRLPSHAVVPLPGIAPPFLGENLMFIASPRAAQPATPANRRLGRYSNCRRWTEGLSIPFSNLTPPWLE